MNHQFMHIHHPDIPTTRSSSYASRSIRLYHETPSMYSFIISNPSDLMTLHLPPASIDCTQQLSLQDELPLLILLARLIRLVIFPPHSLPALPAQDVPHNMPASGHVSFRSLSQGDVDDGAEEIGFAVLAAEVLCKGGKGQQIGRVVGSLVKNVRVRLWRRGWRDGSCKSCSQRSCLN